MVIATDNRFDDLNRPLHMPHFDWYSYGGVIRSVELIEYTNVIIDRVVPTTIDYETGAVAITVNYRATADRDLPLTISVNDTIVHESMVSSGNQIFRAEITVDAPRLWSPEHPNLYRLKVRIADFDTNVNLGVRQIETAGNQILLNGHPIPIKGVNRHESHVQFGFALPPQLHLADLQLLKDMGCNFVRISHYPPDPVFLDLCDQLGILVWCEATSWGYDEKMTTDPRMLAAQQQCITEMIQQNAHHPSIVCWGFFNECASCAPAARPIYEELVNLIRRLDPSRSVTYATMHSLVGKTVAEAQIKDLMFDLVDWIGINVYPGWYGGELEDCDQWLDNLAQTLQQRGFTDKPIIISEIGAGGIVGFEHYNPIKWSLSYQSEMLKRLVTYIKNQPLFNGLCIWQFCDIRTSEHRWQDRPRNYNSKGFLDEYRRPKPAYHAVKDIFHQKWIAKCNPL